MPEPGALGQSRVEEILRFQAEGLMTLGDLETLVCAAENYHELAVRAGAKAPSERGRLLRAIERARRVLGR